MAAAFSDLGPSPTFRTRFSPAPTGYLHVGSARSALFCWLAARHEGGEVMLRVEDTNPELYRAEFLDSILWTLDWLGLGFDGEPVFQSQRAERYSEVTEKLLADGAAYYCDCSTDDVKTRAEAAGKAGAGYDGRCRQRDLEKGADTAVRFRVPTEGQTAVNDLVRGTVTFDNATIDDFVIQRSNGSAVFFLPNAVDDLDMKITHVARGDDLLNTTPKVLLIRHAMGVEPGTDPIYAHVPMIVNQARKKLSKRRDDVSVEDFRSRGYLPEAMSNYLAVLGWGPPDGVEIRPRDEIIELFSLEAVVPSSAFFDVQKLDHFNATYLRAMSGPSAVEAAAPWLAPGQAEVLGDLAPHIQERARTLSEFAEMSAFLLGDEVAIDETAWAKGVVKLGEAAEAILEDAAAAYANSEWVADRLHVLTGEIAEKHGLGLAKAQAPVRVALTGRTVGPPLFESMVALGRERVMARLAAASKRLTASG